jgi:hypothetical protein
MVSRVASVGATRDFRTLEAFAEEAFVEAGEVVDLRAVATIGLIQGGAERVMQPSDAVVWEKIWMGPPLEMTRDHKV